MRFVLSYRPTVVLWTGLLCAGVCASILGCRGKKAADKPVAEHSGAAKDSAALAEKAAVAIAAVCMRQSYATASVGLIAGATGLQEDVFELRDPGSYKVVPYRLGATMRLETLLRQEAESVGRPAAQAECMRQFADRFKQLTDPLVDEALDEKKIDKTAFKDAEKEAQQERQTEEQPPEQP